MSETKYNASQVRELSDSVRGIRLRPEMYLGTIDGNAVLRAAMRSIGKWAARDRTSHITIAIQDPDSARIDVDGQSLPVTSSVGRPCVEQLSTNLWLHDEFGSNGILYCNALSAWFDVEVHDGQRSWRLRFERGEVTVPLTEVGPTDRIGNVFHFKPDAEIVPEPAFDAAAFAESFAEFRTKLAEDGHGFGDCVIQLTDEASGTTYDLN